jgi:hypothetical protein
MYGRNLQNACMNNETRELMKEIAEINLAYQHKPFNPATGIHKKFLASYFTKTRSLQNKYPVIDWGNELEYFRNEKM